MKNYFIQKIFLKGIFYHTLRMKFLLSLINKNKWVVQDQILNEVETVFLANNLMWQLIFEYSQDGLLF